ncbi:hypothetical protein Q8A73_002648 [Channa argus]|nr:hypothetical protein Q8A73_002648 [Channa argus]
MATVTVMPPPLLLLLIAATSAQSYSYFGGSVAFTRKGRDSNGAYEVCLGVMGISSAGRCCNILSDKMSLNRYPATHNTDGYWNENDKQWGMLAHVDLGIRSDTGQSNRPPVTSVLPLIRVPRNCPRSFNVTVFDPDGDQVRCRVPTDPDTNECKLCSLPRDFSLDQSECTLERNIRGARCVISSAPSFQTAAPLSELPVQFSVLVDNDAPSCLHGDFIPIFLRPTLSNGVNLLAFVNNTLEIKWTPTQNELDDHFPICFVSEAKTSDDNSVFHSELRCVIVYVAHHKATVTCNQTTIMVEVKKDDLIRHNENNLHLNDLMDPACDLAARSNTTHLMAVMSLKTCGTKIEEDDDNIFFKNQITTSDTNETISRTNDVEIAFLCVYPKRANMTLGFTHKNPYSFSEKSFGTFNFQFEFFESQLFQNQIAASRYPVQFDLQQMIFMQIDASTFTPTLELFVESCRATPYDNPNSHISYSIIENGYTVKIHQSLCKLIYCCCCYRCVKDDTVQIYSSSPSQFKFGMEAFEFIGAYPEVYITCTVILCEAGVPGTRCSQGCTPSNSPGKREVAAQTSKHSISQGPLLLVKTSASKASGLSLNLGLNVLLIVGCLLICAVVIYRSRRFKANAFAIV